MLYLIYVTYIVPAAILIPVLTGIKNYNFLTKPLKVILWFLVFQGFANVINLTMIAFHYYTTPLFHVYSIFEFLFISLFYSKFYSVKKQKSIYALIAVFTVLCIINYLFIQNKIEFNTYTRPLEAIIIIVYSMLFILKQNNEEQNWGDDAYNWINAGILIYFASCLFMFIFSNYLLGAGKLINRIVWGAHDTILLLQYILFAVGLYKCKTQRITSTY
ncbi:hypothetical protein IDJ75_00570 [Mucilaginibacter rigui]|uniref:Uncharacterized protein n=1 Tax=Mucilaginibacter rigui TaxID=534635 RepID=A0ABR7WZJ3_9SPHI|nr:hypothetical protein [Mucilaginibacter rigui]MBD1383754.1 hypothetical protein [Mucilaginibacter rigui]